MSRTFRVLTLSLGAALLVAPTLADAQAGRGAPDRPRRMDGSSVTALLNARRQLDLTPRQVAQLDSIERVQHAERQAFAQRMRPMRDSLTQRARADVRTPAQRDSLRAQARARVEAQRPQIEQRRQRDSTLNAAAERVLNDTQRQRVREMQAERRGFERGMREGRGDRGRPQGGERGPGGRGGMPPRRPPMGEPEGL